MIKAPIKKMSLITAIAVLASATSPLFLPDGIYREAMENDFIQSVRQKLTAYHQQLPEDRVYLQLDKPLYEPGDNIWFSGYIRDGESLKPSAKSDIVSVELINPKGTIEKKIDVIARNGKVSGDFLLSEEALGGLYKIKAYTNWMKNENDVNCFEKEIQVQEVLLPNLKMKLEFEKKAFGAGEEVAALLELTTNENRALAAHKLKFVASLNGTKLQEQTDITNEDGMAAIRFKLPKELTSTDGLLNIMIDYNGSTESISRSIPIVLNKIKFDMFPEGGDMVVGLPGRVAFRAMNEFDKPADVEGIVVTDKGSRVGSFSSFHNGMGAFQLNPQHGERYRVKITKPVGIKEEFYLPAALERGYSMSVDNSKTGELAVEIGSTENEQLALIAQVRGKMYYSTVVEALPGSTCFSFPTSKMPAGVCQLTLFDSKGIARAERLCFVNRDKQLNISVETDKEKYLPREKVKMTIMVKDERGLPMPANLSMAVVNDQLLSFSNDKSGNILSQLLLQPDIKEKVEEPAFYFDRKENKSGKALDYLLMTAGWRRFSWEKLLEDQIPPILFQGQKAIVNGSVIDAVTRQVKAQVTIKASSGDVASTDAAGRFTLPKLDLSAPVVLTFSAEGYQPVTQTVQDYETFYAVTLYPNGYNMYEPELGAMEVEAAGAVAPQGVFEDMLQHKAVVVKKRGLMGKAKDRIAMREALEPLNGNPLLAADKAGKRGEGNHGALGVPDFKRDDAFKHDLDVKKALKINVEPVCRYYRARVFAAPNYNKQENVETRVDFRNTIYWNPAIEIGHSGRKTIEFFASDDITSFRTTVEGIAGDGSIGREEKNFFTQLPFAISARIPLELAAEDIATIPVTLKNNTNAPLGGLLTVSAPAGLKELRPVPQVQTIMPGKAKTIYLDYQALSKTGTGEFSVAFKACGLNDGLSKEIRIVPKGFPQQVSFSGQDAEKEYEFELNKVVHGSLRATFNAYPNVVSDLMKGVEGILSEPYGCFEQTSCTAYPNAMVLDYLRNTGSKDSKTLARATDLLDRGYKRLTTFETPGKGYEWFGANPAHEGLTAYGIMEFVDMKRAGQEIDQEMLDRTAQWLLRHKDGKGGFEREKRALHDFGRISDDVLNAYIVYALAEAGYSDIKKEFETSYGKALESKDPYMLAMMANAAYSLKDQRKGDAALNALLEKQEKDGSFNGTSHSITYSQGQSLCIETTALSIMALLKPAQKHMNELNNAVHFLVGTRSGSGVFSSTQGTILALKCLTEFAKFSKRANEDGTIVIYIDNKKVAERQYRAGDKGSIVLEGLEAFVAGEGKHHLKVKYLGAKNPLPYSVAVNWNTYLPASDKECVIDLKTHLLANTAHVGETVRLATTISNKSNIEVPSTMAILGIPAGFGAQPWQLKELQERKVFDYYEMKGNYIAIYYRGMAPGAVKEINLDLKAEIAGEFDAPASSAYLYYTNEHKTWVASGKVTIHKGTTE